MLGRGALWRRFGGGSRRGRGGRATLLGEILVCVFDGGGVGGPGWYGVRLCAGEGGCG